MAKQTIATLETEFTANTRDVDRGFAHVERRARESTRKINSTLATIGSAGAGGSGGGLLSGIAEGLKILPGLGMVASGFSKIAGVMQSGVQMGFSYNRMIEESQIGFEKHFKSVDKARSHIQELIGLRKDGGGSASNALSNAGNNLGPQGQNLGFFAAGGRPPMGRASIVGERGPELFIPDMPGRVFSNNDSRWMMQPQSQTSRTINLTVNFQGQNATPTDRRAMAQTARQLRDLLEHEVGRGG